VSSSRRWFLALVCLLPCRLQGAPLTFAQALELAINHNRALPSSPQSQPPDQQTAQINGRPANHQSCPIRLQDYAIIAAQLVAASESGLPLGGPIFAQSPDRTPPAAFDLTSRRSVVLCTALLFANLDGIQAQQHVLSRQQELAARLIDIESRRVSVDVDHPLLLTQAKLLRARARVESAALGASERKMRAALSTLLGRPLDQAGIVENSMPPLPENPTNTLEDSETLQQLLACRDLVQLDYLSEYLARLKAAHDMELAKASIGTLVAAHITEGFKFNALLQLNNQIRLAKIQFLGTTGDLEPWALGQPGPNADQPPAPPEPLAPDSPATSASPPPGAPTPPLLSLLIAPSIKELPAGKSQQFSAIATYSDGHASDVTAEAHWSSIDSAAILSTTGLLTGLSPGEVTVQVEFQGMARSRKLSITEQPSDEYLRPDHRNIPR